ncbi:MAG: hypothetical protein E7010_04830 [Alphaproteobacteria bacterium]|nr:hypothetical protein [Alphaproteobacteria bacterium]
MEWMQIFQAVLSLMFVIGLLLLTVYFFKYCEQKGLKSRFVTKLKAGNRINVIENRRLDAKSSLILVECDNTEYLIFNGTNSSLMLHSKTISRETSAND